MASASQSHSRLLVRRLSHARRSKRTMTQFSLNRIDCYCCPKCCRLST
ncbi:unnamed protein product [Ectocarpus sp. 8 AP-2014]